MKNIGSKIRKSVPNFLLASHPAASTRASLNFAFVSHTRSLSASSMVKGDPFKPAARVAGQKQDVW